MSMTPIKVVLVSIPTMLRFTVTYKQPKKKGFYSQQEATFLDPEGAEMWKQHIEQKGCIDIKVAVS